MGKQAKLKKLRKQAAKQPQPAETNQPTQFVEQLQRHGYQLKSEPACPELPEKRNEPQV